nr:MAG TPA: hypothetical protein [Caudoviricetes sp.]
MGIESHRTQRSVLKWRLTALSPNAPRMGKKKPRPVLAHRTRHLRNIYQNVLRIVYHDRRGKARGYDMC